MDANLSADATAHHANVPHEHVNLRREWFSILCLASESELQAAWERYGGDQPWRYLRAPEIVLVMVSARAGGDGQTFHVGEAPAVRCVVELGIAPVLGYACVVGRSIRKAVLIALLDARLQQLVASGQDCQPVLAPMRLRQRKQDEAVVAEAASTKVDFFTMVRGE
ncbi:MAG: phosphonate C-P lyase system protein PhnG [Bryobacterales bacterium]|jgi:alpha-D-ribose 1-methylphosphonate 5-triphosphate synthase subunit PhnG|nr:phosphonate C-P lyase system protein PhnG [Bryobacterales bacterium]